MEDSGMSFSEWWTFKWLFKQWPYGEQFRTVNGLFQGPEAGFL